MKNFILAVALVLFCAAPAMARGGNHGGGNHGGGNHGGGNHGHNNGGHYNHGRYGYRVAPVYPWWVWVPGYGYVYRPYANPYYPQPSPAPIYR